MRPPSPKRLASASVLALALCTVPALEAQDLVTPSGTGRTLVDLPGVLRPPTGVNYVPSAINVPEGQPITPLVPSYSGGTPTAWSIGPGPALPQGLVIDAKTGVISGTPVQLRPPTSVKVQASNATGTTSSQVSIGVFGVAPSGLSYTPQTIVLDLRDGPFTFFPTVSGGPVDSWNMNGPPLPVGIYLDPATGILSGIPRATQGAKTTRIFASNETGSTSFDVTFQVVLPAPPSNLAYSQPGPLSLGLSQVFPIFPSVTGRVDSYSISPALPNRTLTVTGGNHSRRPGVLLPDNAVPIDYTPPEQTILHPDERLNVWLPQGQPPDGGWPCVLSNPSGAYGGGPPITQLDPKDPAQSFLHQCVNQGIAVVVTGLVGSGPLAGWFYPPGHVSGRWEDPDWLVPEKDVLHALQWLKIQSTYPIDADRIFLHGVSSGATIAAWVGLGRDLRQFRGSTQVRTSSRVAGVLCFDTLFSFPAYDDENDLVAKHWESVSNPGTSAVNMGDADPLVLDANSVARVILSPVSSAATTPVFLAYDCPGEAIDFANDTDGFPRLRGELLTYDHDLWHGAKFWERLSYLNRPFHVAKSEFFIGNGNEEDLGSLTGVQTGTYVGTVLDSQELYAAALTWLDERSTESIPDPSGLVLHPKSGLIYGTPNTEAPFQTYQITATNPGGSTSVSMGIEISGEAFAQRAASQGLTLRPSPPPVSYAKHDRRDGRSR